MAAAGCTVSERCVEKMRASDCWVREGEKAGTAATTRPASLHHADGAAGE
jgi:hypothetical protein